MKTGNRNPLELREAPRTGVDLPIEIFTSDFSGSLPGRTRDIGVSGLCATTASPFAAKNLTYVVLSMPDGSRLRVDGRGVWQQALDNDDVVMTGVAFSDISEDVTHALWDLVLDIAKDFARFIHNTSEISGIGIEGAMALAQITRVRSLPAGSVLFRQGPAAEEERSLFLIDHGTLDIEIRVRDAIRRPLGRLERGRLIGGLPMIAGGEHPETATAAVDSRLLEIDPMAFSYLQRAKPWLAHLLCQAVTTSYASRLQTMLAQVRDTL